MLTSTIYLTIVVALLLILIVYVRTRDTFHPLLLVLPMFVFIYGYLPLSLIESNELFSYVTEDQAVFAQILTILIMVAFSAGCFLGADVAPRKQHIVQYYDPTILRNGAILLGSIGLAAWLFMVRASGGLSTAFGNSYGMVWSDIGYIRDSVFLLIVAILLLLSPQAFSPTRLFWWVLILVFSAPWAIQGLLGARRGPTFTLALALGISWFMARGRRPSLVASIPAGIALGVLMLFLVSNRNSIYLGSDLTFDKNASNDPLKASEANEYIFSTGCIAASRQTGSFFWGRRLLAQFLVRPIPRQLWPTKYADFGIPELEQNAGVAGVGLETVMGWAEVPGAAAAMVADMWVEFSWGAIPFAGLFGWAYGYCWKRATIEGSFWITQYVILLILSLYLVTQGLEPVIFRLLILSLPAHWVWRLASLRYAAVT